MVIQTWTDVLMASFQSVWAQIAAWLPSLIGALALFIIGLIIAAGISSVIERVFRALRVDVALRKLGIEEFLRRADLELNSGYFFGQLMYWFIVLAFLLAASDILGFFALSSFIQDVLLYLPNVAIAVLIMIAALVIANLALRLIRASVLGAEMHSARFLASAAWWAVMIFGILAALMQLGIAVAMINTIVTGFVAMIALAGGLAFGLGGKDFAAHFLQKLQDEIEGK
ncbi:hypothetical protein KGO95_03055 [Patescibacteria group bacterium]|nr:hypothetical protein [Patescibacteria group bacterium]